MLNALCFNVMKSLFKITRGIKATLLFMAEEEQELQIALMRNRPKGADKISNSLHKGRDRHRVTTAFRRFKCDNCDFPENGQKKLGVVNE